MTPLLVIGYGNELRGDDAVGPRAARLVASWQRTGVKALAVPQLAPELAAELADAERVAFVDAAAEGRVRWRPVAPVPEAVNLGHVSTPGWLLGLAGEVFGRAPEAWLVTVPARQFEYGAPLTPLAADGLRVAVRQLAAFADRQRCEVVASA